jgi:hypothetical protein
VNRHTIIIATAVVLTVTMAYWLALPQLFSWTPVRVFMAAVAYFFQILLMIVLMMAVIEGRLRLLIGAAAAGFIIGAVPGPALIPLSVFLPLWLMTLIPPIVMGIMVNHGFRAWKAFGLAFLLMSLFVLMYYAQIGPSLVGGADQLRASIEKTVTGPMAASGYNTEAINTLVDQLYIFMKLVMALMPSLLILASAGQLFAAFLLTEWYYIRRDSYFPGFGPFIYWKMPEKLLYLLGALILVRLLAGGGVRVAVDNALFIMLLCYAVAGLAVMEHLLKRLRLPMLVRIVFYIGLAFMHIIGLLATSLAGLFDSYFDFRKVRAHTLG